MHRSLNFQTFYGILPKTELSLSRRLTKDTTQADYSHCKAERYSQPKVQLLDIFLKLLV